MSMIDLSEEQRYCHNDDTTGSVRIVGRMCEIPEKWSGTTKSAKPNEKANSQPGNYLKNTKIEFESCKTSIYFLKSGTKYVATDVFLTVNEFYRINAVWPRNKPLSIIWAWDRSRYEI